MALTTSDCAMPSSVEERLGVRLGVQQCERHRVFAPPLAKMPLAKAPFGILVGNRFATLATRCKAASS